MQLHGELDVQASQTDAAVSSRKRKSKAARKVTVRITEEVYEQLQAATERPGVGKSMVVEAALERFLSPRAPVEDLLRKQFDQIHARLERFDSDLRIIAETVALHARYHLTVLPPLPESQQHEACLRGDERFKVLAEQVDRRVRLGRPLMQETIDRLSPANLDESELEIDKDAQLSPGPERVNEEVASERDPDSQDGLNAAAGEGGSIQNFRHLPNSSCSPARERRDRSGAGHSAKF